MIRGQCIVAGPQLNHDSIRIRFHTHRKIRALAGIEHHTRYARNRLRNPYSCQRHVAYVDGLPFQTVRQRGVVQVKINALWGHQAMHFIRRLVLHIDNHGAPHRRRPVADSGDLGQHRQLAFDRRRKRRPSAIHLDWIHQVIGCCGNGGGRRRIHRQGHIRRLARCLAVVPHPEPYSSRKQSRHRHHDQH